VQECASPYEPEIMNFERVVMKCFAKKYVATSSRWAVLIVSGFRETTKIVVLEVF
jgi:hypothetical protein